MFRLSLIISVLICWLTAQPAQIYFGEMNLDENYLEVMVDIYDVNCGYQFTITGLNVEYVEQVMWPECYGGVSDEGTVVGWFANGLPLNPESGVMVNLIFEQGDDSEVCIVDPMFAGCGADPPQLHHNKR